MSRIFYFRQQRRETLNKFQQRGTQPLGARGSATVNRRRGDIEKQQAAKSPALGDMAAKRDFVGATLNAQSFSRSS
ncbi:MAG: hypothetical protein EAZ24_03645 [Burkholderiales bacterium]|nr:MAG: hypothetical protein EAZ21_09560 [Betaproteobacteria bacterium]TAG82420.1 MAG: hypothetical protein EAZ24_03645 [Burkholderiales bacterium]